MFPMSQGPPGQMMQFTANPPVPQASGPTGFGAQGQADQQIGGSLPAYGQSGQGQISPQAPASDAIRQGFQSPNQNAPYYNAAGVAGNLGTMAGGAAQPAADFLTQLFNPNLNQMESNFMGASLGNALTGLEQGFNRQESQFEDTPFHSGLLQAQGDTMEQMTRDMFQTGAQLGLQREQTAAGQVNTPFNQAMGAAQVPVQMQQQMTQQANSQFQQPYQIPQAIWSGVPVSAPSIVANQGSQGKSF